MTVLSGMYDGQGRGGGTRFLPRAPGDLPGQRRYAEGHRLLFWM